MLKHNKDIIIGIVSTAAIFAALLWFARPAPSANLTANLDPNARGILTAVETDFDFGRISMANGEVSHRYAIKNAGTEQALVTAIYTSCMCTRAILWARDGKAGPFGMPGHGLLPRTNKMIAPGETAEIEAIFDPNAHGPAGIGPIDRVISIETAGASQPLELKFKGLVTP